jgi:hypothetical protein
MTVRTCAQCGTSLAGRSSRAIVCSSTCRARRAEGAPAREPAKATLPDASSSEAGYTFEATYFELKAAGRERSALGVASLALATRVDNGAQETGAAFAALVRELRATLTSALADAEAAGDGVDDLRKAREAKLARARGTA